MSKADKKQVKKIAANQVNTLAPGLSVANANNAGTVDNIDSTGLVQVKTRVRSATDTSVDTNYADDANLLQVSNLAPGQYTMVARMQIDNDEAVAATLNCDLVHVATELDTQSQVHGANGTAADILGYTLIGTFTAGAAGTDDAFVRCTSVGGTTDADNERIDATLINN